MTPFQKALCAAGLYAAWLYLVIDGKADPGMFIGSISTAITALGIHHISSKGQGQA